MTILANRRALLAQASAGLALAPQLARAVTGTRLPPPAAAPAGAENIQGGADAQNRLTVDTWVNGKGPFQFVVDTGADRSVISEELATALGLAHGDDMIVQGIARAMPAASVQLDNLRIGRITIDSLPMPVLPKSWLGADGYLGLDVIDRQSVTFDFQNHRLTIEPSDHATHWIAFSDQALVRVDGSDGRLTAVNCSVDGIRAYAFVDSGAQISIGNTRLFAELQKDGATFANDETIQLLGVTGGAAAGRVAAIESIKLGSIRFANSALVIADLPVFEIWGLDQKPALFIGMNFLRQLSQFTIDYGRKELRFKLAQFMMASRA
ncbi:MAG TPA: aspartyl protease family protein [Rhizomicrobium sp.]|jgi:predicted aspartyl protease|nr:aspartyl protease family protein [Rhizomicrobium sp.]